MDDTGRKRQIIPEDCCMPSPFALVCRLDNALGVHEENISWRCYLHDWMIRLYLTVFGG